MADAAIVEGSRVSPSVYLAAGRRRLVPLSRQWQALIDAGHVVLVARVEVRLGRRHVDE